MLGSVEIIDAWEDAMKVGGAIKLFVAAVVAGAAVYAGWVVYDKYMENRVLKQIVERLTAQTRVAEVLVTGAATDANTGQNRTTIKFLEYDTEGAALAAKYFTFTGNVVQFQSLVIRFDDRYVKMGDALRGKSAYIFLKAFALHGTKAEVFEINKVDEVPSGYAVRRAKNGYEERLWKRFWELAKGPELEKAEGIKNVQIEAPGTQFVPGLLYTIMIEHDGGMRIDTQRLPEILKGERF